MKGLKCPNCGSEISEDANSCSNCNFSLMKKNQIHDGIPQKSKMSSVLIKRIVIIVIVLLFVFFIAFFIMSSIRKKNEYKSNFSSVTYKIFFASIDAEDCSSMIKKVWYNSIYEEDDISTNKYTKTNGIFNSDFNTSLRTLFNDNYYLDMIEKLDKSEDNINELLKKIKNPSKEWKEAYEDLKKFYDSYLSLSVLCKNPTGSYNTYSQKYYDVDNETLKNYNKVKAYLEF